MYQQELFIDYFVKHGYRKAREDKRKNLNYKDLGILMMQQCRNHLSNFYNSINSERDRFT